MSQTKIDESQKKAKQNKIKQNIPKHEKETRREKRT